MESQHKTLQRAINIALQTDDNIDLFDCIYEYLYNYNYNCEHSSTGYKPIELKDTNNINLKYCFR